MGLLDDLLGGLGGTSSDERAGPTRPDRAPGAGGMGSIMMALLPVLLSMLAGRRGGAGGGLDDVLGQVLGGGARAGRGGGLEDLLGGILGGGAGGGLGGLLEQMDHAGFGRQARSWVGTGQNEPVSPDALGEIFGPGGIEAIAQQAGLTPGETTAGLSQLLPEVVDRLTPRGQVPDFDQLVQSVDALRSRLSG
jgi:uncharacterized protein YidB (DUF937 family)